MNINQSSSPMARNRYRTMALSATMTAVNTVYILLKMTSVMAGPVGWILIFE
jgi:hypothetical protein